MYDLYDNGCPDTSKTVTITLFRSQLLYDIRNVGYIQSDSIALDESHVKHLIADIGEDGNVDRVTRIMSLAFQECANMIYRYSKKVIETGTSTDDMFKAPESYKMTLKVPAKFSEPTLELLKDLAHEYMVSRTLYDWMGLCYPQARNVWKERLEELEERIKTASVYNGETVLRIKPYPF